MVKLLWGALDYKEGELMINGVNLKDFDLKKYRNEICVISQETNLFEGTLLSNITTKKTTKNEMRHFQRKLEEFGFDQKKLSMGNL